MEWIDTFILGNELYSNPVIHGVVSLWGLTVLTFLLRNIPEAIFNFFTLNTTITLTLDNTTSGKNALLVHFMKYCMENSFAFSRTFGIETLDWDGKQSIIGPGYGLHFLIENKRLFWFQFQRLDSSGSELQKKEVVIHTLGRNKQHFIKLLEKFRIQDDFENSIKIHRYDMNIFEWDSISKIPLRTIESVITNNDAIYEIQKNIQSWSTESKWYHKTGIAYKLCILLHGIPGTGKTSIIKALASHFKKDIAILNINNMSSLALSNAIHEIPKNTFLIIEDFDSSPATHTRFSEERTKVSSGNILTTSDLLNILDGVTPLNDIVIFLTTNHLSKIDPALYRKGRVDFIYEIHALTDKWIKKFIHHSFPNADLSNKTFKNITGCDAQHNLLQYKNSEEEFIQAFDTE